MKIHFIGIGGIGVSALAQYYLEKGAEVSGSDLVSSEITDLLEKKGAKVSVGKHKIPNSQFPISKKIPNSKFQILNLPELVVYSPAVEDKNPELRYYRKNGVKCLSYPQALGELTRKYFTIAVSGAHGKSTTTAMIGLILIKAGLNPTVILGTKLKEFNNTNFHLGGTPKYKIQDTKYKILIIEADEWNASFLNYWPRIIVLTNIEREHLDYYKDLNHILRTFEEYVSHLPKEGFLVANSEDNNISKIISNFQFPISNKFSIKQFSKTQKEAAVLRKILKVPGEHNVSNALAALTVARILGILDEKTFKALSEYKGAWRRFEEKDLKIGNCKLKIINDYAHHPTEIKATLKAAREKFPKNPSTGSGHRIWCVFQPHQYQRTFNLFSDFVFAFQNAPIDEIVITDIYSVAGREKAAIKRKVNSKKLVKAINKENVTYLAKKKIVAYLKKNINSGDVVILMGAGDIYELNKEL